MAILQREIGSVSRRWTSYLIRAVFVLLLATIVTIVWASEASWGRNLSYSRMSEAGRALFAGLFVTEIVLVSLVGPLVTGGLIAQERERRTLDLLFMTPMRNFEIVFGKFLSRMAYLLGLILLSTPVLLGCLIFGGVAPDEILLAALLVFISGLWSGAIGMFLSAFTRKGYLAVVSAYFMLLLQCLGLPMVVALTYLWSGPPGPAFFLTSPQLYAIARMVSEGSVSFWGVDIWAAVSGVTTLLSLLLVALSAAFLRREPVAGTPTPPGADTKVRRKAKPVGDLLGRVGRVFGWFLLVGSLLLMVVFIPYAWEESKGFILVPVGGAAAVLVRVVRMQRRRPAMQRRVWENPVAWREIVSQSSPGLTRLVNLVLFTMAGFLFLFVAVGGGDLADEEAFHGIYLGLELCAVLVAAIVLGAASIGQEADSGRLDILLGTPLSPAKILRGKMLGVFVSLAPLLIFMLVHAVAAGLVCHRPGLTGVSLALGIIAAQVLFQISFALYLGLQFRQTGRAIGVGLAAVLSLYLLLPILMAIMDFSERDWPLAITLGCNPVVSIFTAFEKGMWDYSGNLRTMWIGGLAGVLVYALGGTLLMIGMVRRFNRFVQRK